MSRKTNIESLGVKGFFRLQIVDKATKKIMGDSGYLENQITNYGLESCIVALPFKCANSIQCSGILLGSGTGVASDGTNLQNSLESYWSAFAQSTVSDSLTARATVSFDGTRGAATLQEIGVKAVSTDTVIAAKSFASSAITTDQDVNCTYELRYSTS
ncbi:MAG: hypothetical protein PVJ86_00540 [Phycisphaerales bacterium]|jgi:hypothetical protein